MARTIDRPPALTDAQDRWPRECAIVTAQMEGTPWAHHLSKARRYAETGMVEAAEGAWVVTGDTGTYRLDSTARACSCPYAQHHPFIPCAHRTAVEIVKRCLSGGVRPPRKERTMETTLDVSDEQTEPIVLPSFDDVPGEIPMPPPLPRKPIINPAHIVMIKGTPAITYAGILDCAHQLGLKSLTIEVLYLEEDRAAFLATATMLDGGIFSDIGDATPNNVAPIVKPHFIRVASTRAKARALKTATNISMVTAEELGDHGETPEVSASSRPVPTMVPSAGDPRARIEAAMMQAGKTVDEIEHYIAIIKKRYGVRLELELPRIATDMERRLKEKQQPVPDAGPDEPPW